MPIREFKCNECKCEFELILKHSDDDTNQQCTYCGSFEIERLISQGSFVLKGNGWFSKYDK